VKQAFVRDPDDIRAMFLARLKQQGKTKYRFALEASQAGVAQQHTVDEILAPNSTRSPSIPTLLGLLDLAGLEMVIRPKA
jgi:hypothetical protein